ncbi:hypothetical protein [Novosphingobium sp.]|uniref:hypothetical protein n=1 Tax=Novosphingobium sp. TaxID=1874826 RepID=UPI0038BCD2FB
MRRIERECPAALCSGAATGDRRPSCKLVHLATELSGMMRHDRRFTVQAIAPDDLDRTVEHKPCRDIRSPDRIDSFARSEVCFGPTGEAPGGRDLHRIECRETLMVAIVGAFH